MELKFTSTDRNIFKRNKSGRLKKGLYKIYISKKRNAAGTNEIFDKYITTAPIDFHSHGYMSVPACWSKTDVPCPKAFVEIVLDYSFLVSVSNKLLNIKHQMRL